MKVANVKFLFMFHSLISYANYMFRMSRFQMYDVELCHITYESDISYAKIFQPHTFAHQN